MKKRAIGFIGLLLALTAVILIADMLKMSLAIALPVIGAIVLVIIGHGVYPYIQPGWIKQVQKSGRQASAIALAGGQDYLKGIGGYEGADLWLDLPVRVEPEGEQPFEAKMKCRLSQSLVVEAGMKVPVRYDPSRRTRVVLLGDVQTLLESRLKT
jgi:hypothetical protein